MNCFVPLRGGHLGGVRRAAGIHARRGGCGLAGLAVLGWAGIRPLAAQRPAGAAHEPRRSVDVEARAGTWLAFDVSPDGRQLALDLLGQIWLLPAAGGRARALTDAVRDTADDGDPAFAADGSRVFFAGERAGHAGYGRSSRQRGGAPPDRAPRLGRPARGGPGRAAARLRTGRHERRGR